MRDHAPTNPRPLRLRASHAAQWLAVFAGWWVFLNLFLIQLENSL